MNAKLASVFACLLSLVLTCPVSAQFQQPDDGGAKLVDPVTQRWQVGAIVKAGNQPLRNVVATTTAPTDWRDQQVRIVAEDLSPGVQVSYRMVDRAANEMKIRIPSLAAGQEARAIVTFEIKRFSLAAPDETDVYRCADRGRLGASLRPYLAPSPHIESTSPQIKALAAKIGADEPIAWRRVETIYDWVRETVEFRDNQGQPVKSTAETLRDGHGDCDELSSLFIAICRAAGIPARTVRIPEHCYAEFYLVDGSGKGHWFPCQPGGTRSFGQMQENRPVLQKGDSISSYNAMTRRPEKLRFLPSNLSVPNLRPGMTPPTFQPVLERVDD